MYEGNRIDWDKGIRKFIHGDKFVLEVDTEQAELHGRPWRTLGDFGKRKWENFLFLHNQRAGLLTKFVYKP